MAPELSPHAALVLEPRWRRARLAGRTVDLTDAEYALLYVLLDARGSAVGKKELSRVITDVHWTGQGHNVEVHISRLRAKLESLEPERPLIATVRGRGYRYVGHIDVPAAVVLCDPGGVVRWSTPGAPVSSGQSWGAVAGDRAEQLRQELASGAHTSPVWTDLGGVPVQLSAVEGLTGVVIAAWGDAAERP